MLGELLLNMEGTSKTPEANHLFPVSNNVKKLPEEMTQLFHHFVAKLIYLCRCTRLGIHTAVTFLLTRAKQLDKHDYKN